MPTLDAEKLVTLDDKTNINKIAVAQNFRPPPEKEIIRSRSPFATFRQAKLVDHGLIFNHNRLLHKAAVASERNGGVTSSVSPVKNFV
jgi:hypothetical protein